jgi:hypothetical protein
VQNGKVFALIGGGKAAAVLESGMGQRLKLSDKSMCTIYVQTGEKQRQAHLAIQMYLVQDSLLLNLLQAVSPRDDWRLTAARSTSKGGKLPAKIVSAIYGFSELQFFCRL